MARRAFFIVNPVAAGGRTGARLEALRAAAAAHGLEAAFAVSEAPRHAVMLAAEAAPKFDVVVAAGGDGTAQEVATGILSSTTPTTAFAALPVGTGNDVAFACGLRSVADSLRAIAVGRTRRVDVIEVRCDGEGGPVVGHALLFAAVGFACDLAELTTPRVKRWFGSKLCYSVGFFRALKSFRPLRGCVTCNGREFRDEFLLVCAGNTDFAGGGVMHLSPGARWDDGQFDVSLIRSANRVEVAAQFFRLLRGTHIRHPKVSYFPAAGLHVETEHSASVQIDGDVIGRTPATFRLLPRALRVVVPA